MCSFLRRFEVHVSSTDTVESVKEKVAASQLIAFPEHKLMFKGEKMEEGKTMSDYGIQESTGFFVKWGSCGILIYFDIFCYWVGADRRCSAFLGAFCQRVNASCSRSIICIRGRAF